MSKSVAASMVSVLGLPQLPGVETPMSMSADNGRPPPDTPRDLGSAAVSVRAHARVLISVYVLLAFGGCAAVFTLPTRASLRYPTLAVVLVLCGIVTAALYWVSTVKSRRREQLHQYGVATQATVCFVGLEQKRRGYAWVVRWAYIVRDRRFEGVSPLVNIPNAMPGHTIWIVYDDANPNFSRRWAVCEKAALGSRAIHVHDSVPYSSVVPEDPRC